MVPELARQSIIIKSKNQTSIVLGNYECAYCLGILSKAAGLPKDDSYSDMVEWHKTVMDQLSGFTPENENLERVLAMMQILEPTSEIDEQVKELYDMGYEESHPWEI